MVEWCPGALETGRERQDSSGRFSGRSRIDLTGSEGV